MLLFAALFCAGIQAGVPETHAKQESSEYGRSESADVRAGTTTLSETEQARSDVGTARHSQRLKRVKCDKPDRASLLPERCETLKKKVAESTVTKGMETTIDPAPTRRGVGKWSSGAQGLDL